MCDRWRRLQGFRFGGAYAAVSAAPIGLVVLVWALSLGQGAKVADTGAWQEIPPPHNSCRIASIGCIATGSFFGLDSQQGASIQPSGARLSWFWDVAVREASDGDDDETIHPIAWLLKQGPTLIAVELDAAPVRIDDSASLCFLPQQRLRC